MFKKPFMACAAIAGIEFLATFEDCLRKLPHANARAFVLRTVLGAETEEVTDALGVTANHLGVTLYRARRALRQCLSLNWFAKGEPA
jgi:RNA polymerase sigma-70 factor, ECF subfamily